jgi:hypothetical protein
MADPKNKWTRPAAPPAPMFFGEKERNLVKQINDELAERVLGQTIAYYPISIEESNFNDTYGESVEKVSLPPVRVFAYVVVENEQTNDKYGYDYQTKLTVNFHRRRLVEDQNLYVRVGDFVQYGEQYYEIVRTYNDTRYYFGQVEHKFQISAECVKAREGVFRVTPSVDRPGERAAVSGDGQSPAPRPAPYPPLQASYITVGAERKLPNERVLTAGTGITLVDGGAGSTITIAASSPGAAGIAGAVQLQDGSGVSEGSSNLVFLTSSNRLGINTADPNVSLEIGTSSVDNSPAIRFTGLRPRIQFYETDQTDQYQIQASNGMLKWQVQNNDFNDASVKWMMNPDGQMAFRDGAAGEPIPARIYISGSGNSNLLQISSSTAADILVVTGSGRVGIGTDDPSHNLTIIGNMSASSDVLVGGDLMVKGTLIGGSPLKIAGAIEIYDTVNGNGVIASMGDTTGTGDNSISASCILATDITASFALLPNIVSTTQISASTILADSSLLSNLTCSSFVSSSLYYGDGRYLTNVTASAVEVADGPEFSIQFRYDSPIGREISGSSNLTFITSSNTLALAGNISASANISASYFYGDGSKLTGIAASAKGDVGSLQFKSGSAEMSGSSTVVYNSSKNRLTVAGGLSHNRTAIATSHTASADDYILAVTQVPTSVLFDATEFSAGQVVVIKDESGAASTAQSVTLVPSASQTIDGAPSLIIESPYGAVLLYTNGSNWFIY